MVFPVVRYGCENWTIKKAEHWRIDAFELWCCRRLLRVPCAARRSNQSIWKEISPEYSLEGLLLKLKLPYFGHLMQRTDSLEKTLMLGKIAGGRRKGRQRIKWLDAITDVIDMSLSKPREALQAAVHGVAMSQTWLSDWTELNWMLFSLISRQYLSLHVGCKLSFLLHLLSRRGALGDTHGVDLGQTFPEPTWSRRGEGHGDLYSASEQHEELILAGGRGAGRGRGMSEQTEALRGQVELRPAGEGSRGVPRKASQSGYTLAVAGFRCHQDSWKIVFKIICSRKEKIQ